MSEIVEDCVHDDCHQFAQYPDENGALHCRDCYDGPADFSHVPEPRRSELTERYN